jgi:bacillithiol biosynthesis deacetylase BshB1
MIAEALFFGAHPDDVELTSGGLAALLASHGHAVAVVDLTRGEKASRGTVEERAAEAAAAARELGVQARENLGLPDTGLSRHDPAQLRAVIECLRHLRPRLVVAPDREDEHPDHVEASHLIARAAYLARLARFPAAGERHHVDTLLFALYRSDVRPTLVADVSAVWSRRMAALRAHVSQLDPARGPATYLTAPGFLDEVEARARVWGARAGGTYGEAYRTRGPLALRDARVLLGAARVEARP